MLYSICADLVEGGVQPLSWGVGDVVRRLRKRKKGLTHKRLAALTGLDINTLGRLERSSVKPEQRTLETVAKVLGVTVAELHQGVPITPADERRRWAFQVLNGLTGDRLEDALASIQEWAEAHGHEIDAPD